MLKKISLVSGIFVLMLTVSSCGITLFKKSPKATEADKSGVVVGTSDNSSRSSEAKDNSLGQMIEGEWIIDSVGDLKVEKEEDYPYVHFDASESYFYASNGCNVVNGQFAFDAHGKLVFHNVITTMRYCGDVPYEAQITRVLSDESGITVETKVESGTEYLYLINAAGQRAMTLRRPGLDFLNGNWKVVEIDGETFSSQDMTIFFDMAERKVHGNTGCNSFNGNIYIDPVKANNISLTNMAVTMRMCPNLDQQRKFLVALEQTTGAKQKGNKDEACLVDATGKVLITLVRDK